LTRQSCRGEDRRERRDRAVPRFALARDIDPAYGAAFDRARGRGIEAIAYRCTIASEGLEVAAPVPVLG
jgi:DNA-binding sugar fermentation-stimulating protein